MKYPKLSCELDRRRKICPDDLKLLKKLRRTGLSYQKIGDETKFHPSTIYYQLNPKYYKKLLARNAKLNHVRYYTNKKFHDHCNKSSNETQKRRRAAGDTAFLKYMKINLKRFLKNHPNYYRRKR